jgi:iron complex outermembrane recepter protein
MFRTLPTAALLLAAPLAIAQTYTESTDGRTPVIETLTVIAHPLSAEGLALSAEVLEGEDLARSLRSSIGETLGNLPGVHAANFGQAASRPVIHGLSGPRVRVMEDRIDNLDVSVTSADHAVTIEPFLADRIAILKGPSTLLYGTGAIGGVVDVHTGRVPHHLPEHPVTGSLELRRDNNGDRETAAMRLDGGGGNIAWHLDGFWRDADEYKIPGFAESRALRARDDDDHDDDDHNDHDHDNGHDDEGTPILDLKQTRIDVEGGLELLHRQAAGWRGAFGMQYSDREFSAVGEEAFIAPVDTRSLGAFWVGERDLGNFELEAGVRLEGVRIKPSENRNRRFTSYAVSLGAVIPVEDRWSVGLLADYSARAPIAEELFSDGPHLATGAFEIGNPDLDEEKALNLSINVRYADDDWLFNSTLYYTRFADFIFETPTGEEEDDLPVFVFLQEDADFIGFDAELRRTVARWDGGSLALSAMFDTVSAKLDVSGNDNIPRLPPTRYRVGLHAEWGPVRASVDYQRARSQTKPACAPASDRPRRGRAGPARPRPLHGSLRPNGGLDCPQKIRKSATAIQRAESALMHHAEAVCAERGVTFTPIRRDVYELLCRHDRPVGAYELLEELKALRPKAAPITVYRPLDFLLEAGLAHKINALNAFTACRGSEQDHRGLLLICSKCSSIIELEDRRVEYSI